MTERWQRELKKLGGIDAPVSRVRAQIANGPSEDPPQPEPGRSPRQRITAGVVAFSVFAAAGVFAWNALKPVGHVVPADSSGQPLIFDLQGSTASPSTTSPHLPSSVVSYGGKSIPIPTQAVDGWPLPDNYAFRAPLYVFDVPILPESTLLIQGDAVLSTARIGPHPGTASTPLQLDGNVGTLPMDPGPYVLTVTGRWASGTADFTVLIRIQAPATGAGVADVLKVRCEGGTTSIADTVVARQADGVLAQMVGSWIKGEHVAFFRPTDSAALPTNPVFDNPGGADAYPIWVDLPAGTYEVMCYQMNWGGGSLYTGNEVEVQVVGQAPPAQTPAPVGPTVHLDFNTTSGTPDCPGSPEATISYGDQSTKAAPTSYTWTCPGSSMIADTVTPSFSDSDFVQVPVGTRLVVSGDLTAAEGNLQSSPGDYPWTTLHDLGDLGGGVDLSFDPGRYVIEVTAHWPNGALHFYFPIELEPDQPVSSTPPPSLIPHVLEVNCDGGVPRVVTPTVPAQRDGVHIQLVGNPPPNTGIAFFGRRDGSTYLSRGDDPAQGLVWQLGTGTYEVKCYQVGAGVNPAAIDSADSVDVVDPNGFWVSTYLDCPFSGQIDVRPGSYLPNGSAEASIRAGIPGLLASDTIEPAGYVRAIGPPVYRVVRNGSTIAALSMGEANDVATVVACNDAGLG